MDEVGLAEAARRLSGDPSLDESSAPRLDEPERRVIRVALEAVRVDPARRHAGDVALPERPPDVACAGEKRAMTGGLAAADVLGIAPEERVLLADEEQRGAATDG